jgi:uncharacterized protein (DUF58 family)
MAVSGVLGWHNIRGLTMRIELPDEIYRGLATLVTIRLTNARRFLPAFLLQVRVFGKTVTANLIKKGDDAALSFVHIFPERGALTIPFGEIYSPFPINFFVRCLRTAIDQRLLIFPTPVSCGINGSLDKALQNGGVVSSLKGYEGDVSRIADYTGSEPMKLIHWRLSAKHDEFKVKEMNSTSPEPVILDPDALPGRTLEENLSCASFLVNRLIRANRPVGLKVHDRVIIPAVSREHRLRLLAELAVYGKN